MSKSIWSPQPRQSIFMSRPEFEALYGGAAGGGKSDALVVEALRQVNDKNYRGIIFRKTYPQLTELIDRSLELYPLAFPRAKYNMSNHCWTFSSGAKINFGSMQYKSDVTKYQGKAFQYIAFDELTHFRKEEYMYMFSRCRARGKNQRCYIRATANPGGVGHAFVKERFVDHGANNTIMEELTVKGPSGKIYTLKRDRIFIPSSVFDNEILLANSPEYLASLSMLPEKDRQALLYGDWNQYEGMYYPEFRQDTHVINELPDDISTWKHYRSIDYGLDMTATYWYAVKGEDVICYRELYRPNLTISQMAKEVLRLTGDQRIITTYASPDLFNRRQETGQSGADTCKKEGLIITKANDSRVPGWRTLREYLDPEKGPKLKIYKACTNLIRCIPLLQHDEKNVEDVADIDHSISHGPESLRYFVHTYKKSSWGWH